MEKIKLPELPEVVVKGVVAVKSSDLKVLVDAYNSAAAVLVAQQNLINELATRYEDLFKAHSAAAETLLEHQSVLQDHTAGLKSCREDITKIAKILEELYEA